MNDRKIIEFKKSFVQKIKEDRAYFAHIFVDGIVNNNPSALKILRENFGVTLISDRKDSDALRILINEEIKYDN